MTIEGHSDHIYRALFGPQGTRVATLGYGGNVFVWNAADGKQVLKQTLESQPAFTMAWSPDGKELALGTRDERLVLLTLP